MTSNKIAIFRKNLTTYFSIEELKILAFDLSINPEDIHHQTRRGMALSLIDFCVRNGLIPDLVNICQKTRPHIQWPYLSFEDIQYLRQDIESANSPKINIDQSRKFESKYEDIFGGTFLQGENINLGGDHIIDCPDCFATGLEHEVCSKCGSTGVERFYEKMTGSYFDDIDKDDKYKSLKQFVNGLWWMTEDLRNNILVVNPDNWDQRGCERCNGSGYTLYSIDEEFTRNPCPTCKGAKKILLDRNGNFTSEYMTITIFPERYHVHNHLTGAVTEIAIFIDDKLVGFVKSEPLKLKVKKGSHMIYAGFYTVSKSEAISFDTEQLYSPRAFLCESRLINERMKVPRWDVTVRER
ncbi:MAG: hypothetical protein H6662_15535 [Ardenticatenaceae bacterium]|nr:hypothetical protein [Anaerolineales bacterium]MCB8922999.1 hypothetical protein [Ardenticatenaceae bacterium]MCB8990268.1 hypothetical protein [Ardenticatenaceae bacterium]